MGKEILSSEALSDTLLSFWNRLSAAIIVEEN